MAFPFAAPTPGASLLLSHTPSPSQAILIIGSGNLATSRAFAALEAGLRPLILPLPSALASVGAGAEKQQQQQQVAPVLTEELRWRAEQGQVEVLSPDDTTLRALVQADADAWTAFLDRLDASIGDDDDVADDVAGAPRLLAICVTDTLTSANAPPTPSPSTAASSSAPTNQPTTLDLALARAALLFKLCRRRRILLNVADRPHLCTVSFPAAHRFPLVARDGATTTAGATTTSPTASSLQVAITTNGKGCRLASRLRREIISALPRNVGDAVETVGWLRSLAKDELRLSLSSAAGAAVRNGDGESTPRRRASVVALDKDGGPGTPRARKPEAGYFARQVDEEDTSFDPRPLNSPVPQLSARAAKGPTTSTTPVDPEQAQRRMRWVSQISEYWPIEYLGSLRNKPEELKELLDTYGGARTTSAKQVPPLPGTSAASSSTTFTSPFEAASSASSSTTRHQVEGSSPSSGVPSDIDEAQDRALRAAHDSMRRRSEAGPFTVPDPTVIDSQRDGKAPSEEEDDYQQRGRSAVAGSRTSPKSSERSRSVHSLSLALPPSAAQAQPRGHVYLLGSGPGHPGLLTQFAYRLLTSPTTDLILSDKLVPASILALIPPSTKLEIARKFPGNAEAAQSELIEKALVAAKEGGKVVVRLKQGDPFVYGRGGEEVLAFRAAGVGCTVVPGISSAFAGPLMLGIAVTQRGAADTFVLCTGVGRGGKSVAVPGYQRSTTLAMLMGVARLGAVVQTLTAPSQQQTSTQDGGGKEDTDDGVNGAPRPPHPSSGRRGAPYPPYLPVAIIERASSADQRLVASTLEHIVGALERCGEQRPPGMILVGWTVLALEGEEGDASILDDGERLAGDPVALEARDRARVDKWLGGRGYIVREGLDERWSLLTG